jgi:hypothetical protein
MYCYVSNISVYIANTRSSTVSLLGNLEWGWGWKVRTKQATLLICYRKEALLLVCIKKIQHNQETRERERKTCSSMQWLILLLNYQLILSQQHEPSGCLCAVITDNTRTFSSEPLFHSVNNQQYRKQNCCSLQHFHPSAAAAHRNHILNPVNVK